MSASDHLGAQFGHDLPKKNTDHFTKPVIRAARYVGKRAETKYGNKSKHPGGLIPPHTNIQKPATYVLHAARHHDYKNK